MHFATKEVGWVVGAQQILYTNDGGNFWSNQFEKHSGTPINPRRVFATSENTCWLLNLGSSNEQLFYTQNGGGRWFIKKLDYEVSYNHIFFSDRSSGWLLSDDGFVPARFGAIHITNDAGKTWETFHLPTKGKPVRVHFINKYKGWLIEHYIRTKSSRIISHLYQSIDGGYNWYSLKSFNRLITGIYPMGEDSLFIYGENGFIGKTLNGGRDWGYKQLAGETINFLSFFNEYLCVALCDNSMLFISEDQGETWTQVDTSTLDDNFIRANAITPLEGIITSSKSIFLTRLT